LWKRVDVPIERGGERGSGCLSDPLFQRPPLLRHPPTSPRVRSDPPGPQRGVTSLAHAHEHVQHHHERAPRPPRPPRPPTPPLLRRRPSSRPPAGDVADGSGRVQGWPIRRPASPPQPLGHRHAFLRRHRGRSRRGPLSFPPLLAQMPRLLAPAPGRRRRRRLCEAREHHRLSSPRRRRPVQCLLCPAGPARAPTTAPPCTAVTRQPRRVPSPRSPRSLRHRQGKTSSMLGTRGKRRSRGV
jgi:hypothetical protein